MLKFFAERQTCQKVYGSNLLMLGGGGVCVCVDEAHKKIALEVTSIFSFSHKGFIRLPSLVDKNQECEVKS